jgi:hypothetical protein
MSRRAMVAIPWVMALVVLLILMGLTGSFQVSSARRAIEQLHARRLLDLAAQSALEEASCQVENGVPALPLPPLGQPRPASSAIDRARLPTRCDLREAPAVFRSDGVTFEPVVLAWSSLRKEDRPAAGGRPGIREFGVLQLSLRLQMKTPVATYRRSVTARRYVSLAPNGAEPGVRVRVHAASAMLTVNDS